MTPKPDDFDAVRQVVKTLEPFDENDRLRIIRWACEKLNIAPPETQLKRTLQTAAAPEVMHQPLAGTQTRAKDINSFINQKAPKTDVQFAAVVAYYYRFEAPDTERKESISGPDLQEACRLSNRERLKKPAQTLVNAFMAGYLDKSEHSRYRLNTVGENLVAMVLPAGEAAGKAQPNRKPRRQRRSKKSAKR